MPVKPTKYTFDTNPANILNAIRNSATANYRNYIPAATEDEASIKAIGRIIMDYTALQNEFLSALVNRIGRVILSSRLYRNPWAMLKKGMLEYGETIEEIFVNLAKPFKYDVDVAENEVFKTENPDVRAAFHIMNFQDFYKSTVRENDLRLAFLSWDGVSTLIEKIIESMITSANYDEFETMKYLIARHILNGELFAKQISSVTDANLKAIYTTIKGVSNGLEFMSSTKYNLAGVANPSPKTKQYLICTSDFDAATDVSLLSAAFNMSKAEFVGHKIMVDSFAEFDNARLAQLYGDTFEPFTAGELAALATVPAVLIDEDWMQVYDTLEKMTENYNGQGLYWNYFYHIWKVFSVSPFNNAIVFVPGLPAIESISVSPSTATVGAGQSVLLSANVTTDNFASKAVNWTLAGVLAFPSILVNGGGSAVSSGATSVPFDGAEVEANALAGRKVKFGSATTVYTITANTDSALTITPALAANVADNATITAADSVTGADVPAIISRLGMLTVANDCPAGSTITATATAAADNTKTASATITTA